MDRAGFGLEGARARERCVGLHSRMKSTHASLSTRPSPFHLLIGLNRKCTRLVHASPGPCPSGSLRRSRQSSFRRSLHRLPFTVPRGVLATGVQQLIRRA